MVVDFMIKNRKNIEIRTKKCYYLEKEEAAFMLVEYKVKNFLSFKDEIVLSMVADKNRELTDSNTFTYGNMTLLKCAAVFGANASGKTNLISSFDFFSTLFADNINASELIENIPCFRLDIESIDHPTTFEITFFLKGKRYRYGIELNRNRICAEWLFFVPSRQEACYFQREANSITYTGTYFEDKKALDYIKPDSERPFLYTLGQDSIKEFQWAKDIVKYIRFYIKSRSLPDAFFKDMLERHIISCSDDKIVTKEEVISFMNDADIGIVDLSIKEKKDEEDEILNSFIEFMRQKGKHIDKNEFDTYFHHTKYDSQHRIAGEEKFSIETESSGTAKLYSMLYPILYILKMGGVLLIDEIESSLHPLLCEKIVQLFNDTNKNSHNAQLIFTTHNTLLMNPKILRRDQIYFMEKDKYGVSKMYSLYDIDIDIRSNFNYLNNYLAGRFGAIPYLGLFEIKSEVDGGTLCEKKA
jgi:AAA15 family ATPase/GTPase